MVKRRGPINDRGFERDSRLKRCRVAPACVSLTSDFIFQQLNDQILERIPRRKFSSFYNSYWTGEEADKHNLALDDLKRKNESVLSAVHLFDQHLCVPSPGAKDLDLHTMVAAPLSNAIAAICAGGPSGYAMLYDVAAFIKSIGQPFMLSQTQRDFLRNIKTEERTYRKQLPITTRQQWALICDGIYDGNKSLYNRLMGWTLVDRNFVKRIAAVCRKQRTTVQDWGCGRGLLSVLLALELQEDGIRVEAIDTFEELHPHTFSFLDHVQLSNLYVRTITRPPNHSESHVRVEDRSLSNTKSPSSLAENTKAECSHEGSVLSSASHFISGSALSDLIPEKQHSWVDDKKSHSVEAGTKTIELKTTWNSTGGAISFSSNSWRWDGDAVMEGKHRVAEADQKAREDRELWEWRMSEYGRDDREEKTWPSYVSECGFHRPDPRKTLLISWGRSIDYVVDDYVDQGGRCVIVIGEGEQGCTYYADEFKLRQKHGFKLSLQPAPNFPFISTQLYVFTR